MAPQLAAIWLAAHLGVVHVLANACQFWWLLDFCIIAGGNYWQIQMC